MSQKLNNVKNRFMPIPESVAKDLENEPKITDFEILKELGSSSCGSTYLIRHKVTKAEYALKAIDKRYKSNIEEDPFFRKGGEIIFKIQHPNMVQLYGHFEDNNYCYFIMEYIPKGNLYNLIPTDKKKRLNTKVCASIIKDIIIAIYYLHNMNPPIIHSYIKAENVLLADGIVAKLTDCLNNYIKLEDKNAGRKAIHYEPPSIMNYLAPQKVFNQENDEAVDIWGIGVLLFEIVTATLPFQGDDTVTLEENIKNLSIKWPKDINTDAKDLIEKILKKDPKQRLTLKEMIEHHFISKYFPDATKNLIKPEQNIQYKPYIICKDDPKVWKPEVE